MGKKAKKYAADTRGFCTTSVAKKEEPKPEEEVKEEEEMAPTTSDQPPVSQEPEDEEAEWEKAMAARETAELSKLEANVAAPRPNKELYPCGTFVASSELEKIFEECVAMEELSFPKMFRLKSKLSFERLKSIYIEIEYHGFKHAQISKSMEATLGYDHRAALEYLLITEPRNMLPRTFQTDSGAVTAMKELTEEEKDEQERQRLLQDEIKLQELEAKRVAMRQVAKEAADLEKRKGKEVNKAEWIQQYLQQSDSDGLSDADPHEIIERERKADPTARLVKIEVLVRSLERRAKDLKQKKKQGAFKMNMQREQTEQRELTSQLADYKNEINSLRSGKYGKIAANVDDMIQDALTAEKEAKAVAATRPGKTPEDNGDGKATPAGEEEKDSSEEDDVVDVFALECTEQGAGPQAEKGHQLTPPPHSLQIPKGWTGTLPMKYFEDWVKKNYGKQATVSRNATREGTNWIGTLVVRTPLELHFTATYFAATKGDAFHMVSTTALYEMELLNPSGSKVEKNLPGPYRALYELWAREALSARLEEQRATIRPRLELLDRLLRAQTQLDTAAVQRQTERNDDNDDGAASDSGGEDIVHMRPPPGDIAIEWPPKNGRPLQEARRELPAYDYRTAIIRTISTNKVCIVSGATGSGKTTQCPQYVLEDALDRRQQDKEGTLPMIIVTEPRRISAISVASRVAEEMGVKVGTLVGYQVRMEKKWDPRRTRLLFCTTGVLIRKLRHDPKLLGVTHVFLDEVHERSAESDLTMLLLRRSLGQNSAKIIAMSATLDSRILTSYFMPQTPHLEIPGRLYNVEELFVEDIVEATHYDVADDSPYAKRSWWGDRIGANKSVVTTKGLGGKETTHVSYWDDDDAFVADKYDVCDPETYSAITMQTLSKMEHTRINYELIDLVCEYIHEAFTDIAPHEGSILIFLPGLMEISKSHASLAAHPIFGDTAKTRLISLHSVLSSSDQRLAFEVPPTGIRKIVLATNIAETGVTIPDVVFVIDVGKVKQQRYHEASNTASLKEMFVSQAEATQRRGRAGRIRSGFCFRLYTRSRFESFPRFPIPELLRCSLADLMLSVLCAKQQPSLFEEALDPPPKARVDQAVQLLRGVGAAEDDGGRIRVTSLGIAVAKLPVDVRLGKMLLLHHLFLSGHAANADQRLKVLEGVPIAAAVLSHRSPFTQPFQEEKRASAKKVQEVFLRRGIASGGTSDHLAAVEAFFAFEKTPRKERETWCKKNWLNSGVLYQLGDLKDDLTRHLGAFPPGPVVSSIPSYGPFVTACIAAGLWPNVVRCDKGSGDTKSAISQGAESIKIHASSLLHPSVDGPRWISYYQKVRTRAIYLRDVTLMEPVWLLLFGSLEWDLYMQEKCIAFRNRDWQCIRVTPRVAALLRQIRQRFDLLLRSWLVKSRTKPQWSPSERSVLRSYMKAMTQVYDDMYNRPGTSKQ